MSHSPFDLNQADAYRRWRDAKLTDYPTRLDDLLVEVRDPRNLTEAEYQAILERCRKTNMALYASATGDDPDRDIALALGRRFGLTRLDPNYLGDDDGLTSLTVAGDGTRRGYIPYTNRPIKWHTDGYYNPEPRRIRALLLHCVEPAARGGENHLMDHEMAYIALRDQDPNHIRALMTPDAMTIPARREEGKVARPDQTGPVFFVDPAGDSLYMRYTARARNVIWKDDSETKAARDALTGLLETPHLYSYRGRLEAGMGLVSNNVLHDRSGFEDGPGHGRLLYRARYYDRMTDT